MVGCRIIKTGETNMKNLLIATAVLATLASAPAFANTAPQNGTVTFTGTVAAACSAVSPTTATIPLGALSNGVGTFLPGVVDSAGGTYTSSITCNGAGTKLQMTANQITGSVSVPVGAPAAFTNQIDYKAELETVGTGYAQSPESAGVLVSDATGGTGGSQTIGLLMSNVALDLSDATIGAATTLVAGNYTGSVTITLTPGA
jgi:type 1 fimbria pilin